jgi:cyclase
MNSQHDGRRAMSRREAMALGVGSGLGMLLTAGRRVARAQAGVAPVVPPPPDPLFPPAAAWPTEFREVAPHVFAYVQAGGPGLGNGGGISNAGVLVGADSMMVVDTLGQPFHTKALIAAARSAAGNLPCGRVVNTHQHSDHVNGNQFFPGAEIVAHPFCRQMVIEMASEIPPGAKYDKREGAADGTEDRTLVPPDTTFTDRMTYYYGETVVELIHLGIAHTWGDIVVYLPEHKVMFVGDLVVSRMTPWSHQGHITKWLDVLDRILAMEVDLIVPGHGPIGGKREVAETGEYFRLLKQEARKRFDAGMSPGRAAADMKLGRFDNWIGAERNLLNTFRLYCEFDGTITPMLDLDGMDKAIQEYNAIQHAR